MPRSTGGLADREKAAYALDRARRADVAPHTLCASQRRAGQIREVFALKIIVGFADSSMTPTSFRSDLNRGLPGSVVYDFKYSATHPARLQFHASAFASLPVLLIFSSGLNQQRFSFFLGKSAEGYTGHADLHRCSRFSRLDYPDHYSQCVQREAT
jgi:hypothetical protein